MASTAALTSLPPCLSHFPLPPGNLADLTHPSFARPPVPYALAAAHTNTASLAAAVDAAVEWLGKAVKPLLLAGGWGGWEMIVVPRAFH